MQPSTSRAWRKGSMARSVRGVPGAVRRLLPLLFVLQTSTLAVAQDNDALLGAGDNAADWLSYGHGYANQRHSPLLQINRANVARLVPKWIYQTGIDGTFQTSPIVQEGVIYLTTPRNHIVALDGATGAVRWKYNHRISTESLCCGSHNRGVAAGYGKLFEITADGRLIALDRDSGKLAWDVPLLDPADGRRDAPARVRDMATQPREEVGRWTRFMGNMAPLVYDGMVIVGTTGAGYTSVLGDQEATVATIGRSGPRQGLRAFISAFDATSGRLIWRWYSTRDENWEGDFVTHTASGDPLDRDIATERANAEKYRDAWKRGGGSISTSPALDPELGLIYFGTGNAAPYADLYRPGDNLYTASLVALDVRTGQLRWYHQITPHDMWGYDVAASPMLLDVPTGDGKVPGVAVVTKSGWMYFFNRVTGELIRRSEGFVPQTNLFKRARDEQGFLAVPGEAGGANWPPMAYSAETGWAYIGGSHYPSRFALETDANGNRVNVLTFPRDVASYGTFSAIDPGSGRIVWQRKLGKAFNGGATATAGGLVFLGESDGHLTARDVRNGQMLWKFQTGAGVNAPPVAYRAQGREYVVVAAGGNKLFDIPAGDAVIAFGLPDDAGN